MVDINFTINEKDWLKRANYNPIIAYSTDFICNFTFNGEQWIDIEKHVIFKTRQNKKNNIYRADLGTGMEVSAPIPRAALEGRWCVLRVSVYGGDLLTTNEVSVIVVPTGYTPEPEEEKEIIMGDR